MTAAAALARLDAAGVRVRLRNDGSLNLSAAAPPPPELLALARAHRAGIAALLVGLPMQPHPSRSPRAPGVCGADSRASLPAAALPGVPPDWCAGVASLTTRAAPTTITPQRWATLAATSARMLRDHGAALHGAGWGVLDLFELHPIAPMTHPPGWGLAWLLGEHGDVLDVAPDVIGMRWGPDGARLVFYRRRATPCGGTVLAWMLP